MNEELNELIRQKKELEDRIHRIKNNVVSYGRAKIGSESYPTGRPDRHYISIRSTASDGRQRWVSVVSASTRNAAIEEIPDIIRDLQGLLEEIKKRDEECK